MARKNSMYKVTIEVSGLEKDVKQFLEMAARFGVAIKDTDTTVTTKAASKPQPTNEIELSAKDSKLVESYRDAGCIGYLVDNSKVIAIASYDNKNGGYRLAKTSRNKVVLKASGAVDVVYDNSKYQAAKKAYLDKQHAAHKKCPKSWKLDLYRQLGFYLTAKQEKSIVLF